MSYQYDYSKLKGRIIEKFDTRGNFARVLGKTDTYVSQYLLGKRGFTQRMINLWCEFLEIEPSEIGTYFFTLKVDSSCTEGED